MSIIEVKKLGKKFKVTKKQNFLKDIFKPQKEEVFAVRDISFNIEEGESVAFLGPNGAGKTTTIKMLTGLVYPSTGKISVMNYFPFDRKKEFLMQVGLVMGNKSGLNWDLTPNQSFGLLQKIYRIPEKKFTESVNNLSRLLDTNKFMDTQIRKLSLGERMKMELIGSILHEPKVLFLDEPTIGLDIISKQKIRSFLREIQKEYKITILLTSHEMADIESVCDRVIIINNGSKVYDDSLERLVSKYQEYKYIRLIFKNKPAILAISNTEAVSEDQNSYTLKFHSHDIAKVIEEATNKFDFEDIDINSTPLDEIIADVFRN